MMARPTVVLVGELPGFRLPVVREALERAGYDISRCVGSAESACPALTGGPCPVSSDPVAVMVVDQRGGPEGLPQVCGRALGAPVVVVEAGSGREPEFETGLVRIGEAQGPVAAVQALQELIRASA
jgi:hypothetical protein